MNSNAEFVLFFTGLTVCLDKKEPKNCKQIHRYYDRLKVNLE